MTKYLFTLLLLVTYTVSNAQPPYTGQYNFNSGDPSVNYNKYMVVREDRTFVNVGAYKVFGSPYLLGRNHLGNLYAKGQTGMNLKLSYDIYNGEIEFLSSSNADAPLVKDMNEVDSFLLRRDSLISNDMFFVNGIHLNASDKGYYTPVFEGQRYKLYKKYKAELAPMRYAVYGDASFRQFDVLYDYYYYDQKAKRMKKIKPSVKGVLKEFPALESNTKITGLDFSPATEASSMLTVFATLDNN